MLSHFGSLIEKGSEMATFVLLMAVLLAAASFASYTVQDIAAGYGQNWASDVCYAVPLACQSPRQTPTSWRDSAIFGFC